MVESVNLYVLPYHLTEMAIYGVPILDLVVTSSIQSDGSTLQDSFEMHIFIEKHQTPCGILTESARSLIILIRSFPS